MSSREFPNKKINTKLNSMIIRMLDSRTVKQIRLAKLWEHFVPKLTLLLKIIIAIESICSAS